MMKQLFGPVLGYLHSIGTNGSRRSATADGLDGRGLRRQWRGNGQVGAPAAMVEGQRVPDLLRDRRDRRRPTCHHPAYVGRLVHRIRSTGTGDHCRRRVFGEGWVSRVWVMPENLVVCAVGFNAPMSALDHSARQPERRGRRGVAAYDGPTATIPVLGSPVAATRHPSDTVVLPAFRAPRRRHRRPVLRNEPVTWLVIMATALFGLAAALLIMSLSVPPLDAPLVESPSPDIGPVLVEPTSVPPISTTPQPEPPPRTENDSERRSDGQVFSPSVPDVSLSDDILDRYVPRGIFPDG